MPGSFGRFVRHVSPDDMLKGPDISRYLIHLYCSCMLVHDTKDTSLLEVDWAETECIELSWKDAKELIENHEDDCMK